MGRLDEFLATFSSSSTVNTYKWALQQFFSTIYVNNGEMLGQNAEKYFEDGRDYEKDITAFFASIKERPSKTVRLCMAAVRTFLLDNKVELPQYFWRKLLGRKKGTRAITEDIIPSNKQLAELLNFMPIQGRALFLLLASSGARIGEALSLEFEDIDLERDPSRIRFDGNNTKSGNPRYAFISTEAKESVKEWLKVREDYLKTAVRRSRFEKKHDDLRLFPFEKSTAEVIWRNAIRKARFTKKDANTQRYAFHVHVLRKFFRTRLASVIPVDVVEALMGHEGYLTEVYRKYSVEQLAEFYKQGELALSIYGKPEEVAELKKEIEGKNKELQTIVNSLVVENTNLKSRLGYLESNIASVDHTEKIASWLVHFVRTMKLVLPTYIQSLEKLDEETKRKVVESWKPMLELDVDKIEKDLNSDISKIRDSQ